MCLKNERKEEKDKKGWREKDWGVDLDLFC